MSPKKAPSGWVLELISGTRNNFHGAAAFRAGLDVDIEHPLQPLRP